MINSFHRFCVGEGERQVTEDEVREVRLMKTY